MTTLVALELFAADALALRSLTWPPRLGWAVLAWGWLYGLNLFLARTRFPALLRYALIPILMRAQGTSEVR
jgi:hypothetical protein